MPVANIPVNIRKKFDNFIFTDPIYDKPSSIDSIIPADSPSYLMGKNYLEKIFFLLHF